MAPFDTRGISGSARDRELTSSAGDVFSPLSIRSQLSDNTEPRLIARFIAPAKLDNNGGRDLIRDDVCSEVSISFPRA